MKLHPDTLELFKNFSKVNNQMVLQEGNIQRVMSEEKNVLARARIQETIPREVCIDDMSGFLGIMSLYDGDVEFDFQAQQVIMCGREGKSKITYRYTPLKLIKVPPPSDKAFTTKLGGLAHDVTFDLSPEDLQWIKKSSQVLQASHISVESEDGKKVTITCFDVDNDSSPTQSLEIGEGNGATFKMVYKAQYLKMLPDNYKVGINRNGTIAFIGQTKGVDYYVAAEAGKIKYNG